MVNLASVLRQEKIQIVKESDPWTKTRSLYHILQRCTISRTVVFLPNKSSISF